jgi:hypothetical protein
VLAVNGVTVFNLSNYYVPYYRLGDPFIIQVPVDSLNYGNNTIFTETGDSPTNRTNCTGNNYMIYTALVPAVTSRTDVREKQEGCSWYVAYEDGTFDTLVVPQTYVGAKQCSYVPGNISYDADDTYDVATHNLLEQLDLNNDGEVFVNVNKLDLEITTTIISNIPYMWGPALMQIEVWD